MIHQGNEWQVGVVRVDHQLASLEIEGIMTPDERRRASQDNQELLVPAGNLLDQFLVSLMQLGDLEAPNQDPDVRQLLPFFPHSAGLHVFPLTPDRNIVSARHYVKRKKNILDIVF